MDSYELLVIILSVSLIGVLVAVIVAMVYVIKILQHVHRISQQAERVVDKVESVSEFFKQGAGISSITRLIGALAESAARGRHKSKGKE